MFGSIGWTEILLLLVLGLLIFGKRLPEVGRSLGKGIVEFKKGLAGIEDDVNKAGSDRPAGGNQVNSPESRPEISHDDLQRRADDLAPSQKTHRQA